MGRNKKQSVFAEGEPSSGALDSDIFSSMSATKVDDDDQLMLYTEVDDDATAVTKKKTRRTKQLMTEEEIADRKKRGRRPKEKFNYETDPMKFGKYLEDSESVIIKLPISCLETETTTNFTYTPMIPDPSPYCEHSNFISNAEELLTTSLADLEKVTQKTDTLEPKEESAVINAQFDYKTLLENEANAILEGRHSVKEVQQPQDAKEVRQIDIILQNKSQKEQRLELLVQFANNLFTYNEGVRTDIACFWCCHGFDCHPWGIPIRVDAGKFYLFGVFCSPNCAASYLFNVHNKDNMWDMYTLLNLLYYKVYGSHKPIMHAPDKIVLKKFGGNLDINEYRNRTAIEDKTYIIKFPPSTSVIPVMEEVASKKQSTNTSSIAGNKAFIPIDKTRINQANAELRLKRNKPIHNTQNTLDKCMNINTA